MKITVRCFSIVRQSMGTDRLTMEFGNEATAADVEEVIRDRLPKSAAHMPFRVSVNQQIVTSQHPLCDGDEVALLPPMQGG